MIAYQPYSNCSFFEELRAWLIKFLIGNWSVVANVDIDIVDNPNRVMCKLKGLNGGVMFNNSFPNIENGTKMLQFSRH